MSVLTDLRTYLGTASTRYDDAVLLSVIATETAAQRRKCRIDETFTDPATEYDADLYEALLRRCQTNLARRALPLGLTDVSGDVGQASYVPGQDPEVRRLEGPFRKWVVG